MRCSNLQRRLSIPRGRAITSLIGSTPNSISLRSLLSLSLLDILHEVTIRCKSQYDHLEIYQDTRPINILKSLYANTVKSNSVFHDPNLSSPDRRFAFDRLMKVHLEAFNTRHGMVTETLADAVLSLRSTDHPQFQSDHQLMKQNLPSLLRRQASILILLEHGVALTSSQYFCATGCVVETNLLDLCNGVRNQAMTLASYQYNWSPEIAISVNIGDTLRDSGIVCVPSILRFAILEIFKNALHASAERYLAKHPDLHQISSSSDFDVTVLDMDLPIIEVTINCDVNFIDIVVKDEGTGMTTVELENGSKFLWASTLKAR